MQSVIASFETLVVTILTGGSCIMDVRLHALKPKRVLNAFDCRGMCFPEMNYFQSFSSHDMARRTEKVLKLPSHTIEFYDN